MAGSLLTGLGCHMDTFTRRYLIFLSMIFVVGGLYWFSNLDFRAGELTSLIEADNELAEYPYTFTVVSVTNGVATMLSPRSADSPAPTALKIMFPELAAASVQSDEMQFAQKELAYLQSKAANIVKGQPDIKSIRWTLDVRWLENHGVTVN